MSDQTVPRPLTDPLVEALPVSSRLAGWRPVAVAIVAVVVTAGLGGALTDIGPWYQALTFPDWKPVDAAFPIAWTTIFTLCAVAGVLHWNRGQPTGQRGLLLGMWAFNALMNIGWSALFFAMKRPDLALFQVPVLWLSILALMVVGWKTSRMSSVLLVPYLGWVAVAAALNFEIVRLNGLW
ncbi:MAG: tryptophan-rich sensory protein [Hyphomonadaceae bacterium]|jgi:tryptophan-rich sensory protein|nr:tryptophan-rich sensory protein [Hyphomonadaceae bacterium]